MLTENQLTEWFKQNGIGLAILFPLPLVKSLCRKALAKDQILFESMDKFFIYNGHYAILKYSSWQEVHKYYLSKFRS